MDLFRVPDDEPLAAYDPAVARRLAALLVATLQQELATPEPEALRRASEVSWTVTRERDGTWLNLTHGSGDVIGVGGDWRRNEEALTIYVRQMAYGLVGRERDVEP